MTSVLNAPWFYWAVGVAVGFPVALVMLTELHNALRRRNSALARPVHLVRNYILPLGALLILLIGAMQILRPLPFPRTMRNPDPEYPTVGTRFLRKARNS